MNPPRKEKNWLCSLLVSPHSNCDIWRSFFLMNALTLQRKKLHQWVLVTATSLPCPEALNLHKCLEGAWLRASHINPTLVSVLKFLDPASPWETDNMDLCGQGDPVNLQVAAVLRQLHWQEGSTACPGTRYSMGKALQWMSLIHMWF